MRSPRKIRRPDRKADGMLVVEEDHLRRVADIVGPASAAAGALAEIEGRSTSGEDAVVLKRPGTSVLLVDPRPGSG